MRRAIHGLEVAVEGSLPAELLQELLGGFPEGDASRAPDLTVVLEPADGRPADHGTQILYHGVVRGFARGEEVLLTDGYSSARVLPGGRRIEVAASAASLADRHVLVHVLVLMALVLALRHRGLYHLHAAALARADGRAVLVAGGAGSGKSTLALALLDRGPLSYLGDDACFLYSGAGAPEVLAFPRAFHVAERSAPAFPRLLPFLGVRHSASMPKLPLDPRRAFPGRERARAGAPALVILPQVTGAPATEVEPVPAAVALGALIESSALLLVDGPPGRDENLALLRATVEGARCLSLRLGTDSLAPGAELPRDLAAVLAQR